MTDILFEEFGKTYTLKQLADYLQLDARTLRKHYRDWGGLEIYPGKFRFFEEIVKSKINAVTDNEKRKEGMAGLRNGQRKKSIQTVPGRLEGFTKSGSRMGRGRKKEADEFKPDIFGITDN